jgi:hypothetical protein
MTGAPVASLVGVETDPSVPGGDGQAAAERDIRGLRAAGRLAEAVALIGLLGPWGAADGPDATLSLGAAVLEALGDQLACSEPVAADRAYRDAAADQRAFAGSATSGGEGLARIAEADRIEAKRRPAS